MNPIAKVVSAIALATTIIPTLLFFIGILSIESMKWIVLAGTIGWFISTPMWMGRKQAT